MTIGISCWARYIGRSNQKETPCYGLPRPPLAMSDALKDPGLHPSVTDHDASKDTIVSLNIPATHQRSLRQSPRYQLQLLSETQSPAAHDLGSSVQSSKLRLGESALLQAETRSPLVPVDIRTVSSTQERSNNNVDLVFRDRCEPLCTISTLRNLDACERGQRRGRARTHPTPHFGQLFWFPSSR